MRRVLALFLALIMVLSLAACGSKDPSISAEDKLNKLPTKQETPEKAEEPEEPKPEETEKPAKPDKAKPGKGGKTEEDEEKLVDPEPSQGLDAYDNPSDHPHEGKDLTAFDGMYRAQLPQGDDEETWVQITGFNDFIILEYHGLQAGEIYRYWVEEFWPADGWYTDTDTDSVTGKSQQFDSMAQYENYSGLPQNRTISLTEDGVVLNYDDSDAEYFTRDDSFYGGHNSPEELRAWLGEDVHLDFDYQYDAKDIVGTWGFWDGWQATRMTFAEDGTFAMFWKIPNEPIAVYKGAYGFGRNSGNLEIVTERIGYGAFPIEVNWEWSVDEWGLTVNEEAGVLLDGMWTIWPVEEDFFTVLDADTALGYIVQSYYDQNVYTDQYGDEYSYYYSLPQFYYSENKDLQEINRQIMDTYYSIIEMEQQSMEAGEILSYDFVDWQSAAYNDVLFLHVYAYSFDWEEHTTFYIDLNTMKQLTTEEMLHRLDIDKDAFLDAARVRAEEIYLYHFSSMPEDQREVNGYYECLEQTVSDHFVNLDIPIFVDRYGNLVVHLRICTTAGSGIMWQADSLFDPFYGDYVEEAVG